MEKMEETIEEKKPFDAEVGHDEDSQPDPDEQLMLDQGNGRVWLVKVSVRCVMSISLHTSSSALAGLVYDSDSKISYGTLVIS